MKRFSKTEICIAVITVITVALAIIGLTRIINLNSYRVKDNNIDSKWEEEREEQEDIVYSVNDLSDELLGQKINVVGFMCNPRTDIEGTYICDSPFTSIYDVDNEVLIFNDTVIKYTTYAVIVFGTLEKQGSSYVLGDASIYVYGGDNAKYRNINEMIDDDVIDAFMDAFRAGYVDDNTRERLESAAEICENIGENTIKEVAETLINDVDADFEEQYDKFRSAVVNR